MFTVQRRRHSFSQISNYNSCTGHKHGQTSSRSAACVAQFALMLVSLAAVLEAAYSIAFVHVIAWQDAFSMLPHMQGVRSILLHASQPLCRQCIVSQPVKCLQMYPSAFKDSAMRALGFGTALPLAQPIQMAALGTCCLHQTSLSLGVTSKLKLSMCHVVLYAIHHHQAQKHLCFASNVMLPAAFSAESYTMSQVCFILPGRMGLAVLCCDMTWCSQIDLSC